VIRAIILDFDGTILDTETPDYECWNEIFREHGCELEIERWHQLVGTTFDAFDPRKHLEQLTGRAVDHDAMLADHRRRVLEHIGRATVPERVARLIADARKAGLKVAVASSSPREWVDGNLSRLGLLPLIDTIRCAEDAARPKPYPDLYKAVLESLGINAWEAIAIEDSANGARAARAAGVFCAWLPNPVTRSMQVECDLAVTGDNALSLHALLAAADAAR
jgi:HAD superfamily hydrolase (TIGR01509 family)